MLSNFTSAWARRFFSLSETYEVTLEIDGVSTMRDSYVEQADNIFVSELPGFSKEEVEALAGELGRALDPILAVHADAIVVCERLGGAEMTLGQAINTIWPASAVGAMVIEGLPSVLAEIQKMLNSRIEEPEEEQEETEEEEEGVETEVKPKKEPEQKSKNAAEKAPINLKTADNERQLKTEVEGAKHAEISTQRTEKKSGPLINHLPSKAEMVVNKPEVDAIHQMPAIEILSSGTTSNDTNEANQTPLSPHIATTAVDAAPWPELIELPSLDSESSAISGTLIELDDEIIETAEDKPVLSALDNLEADSFIDISKEEFFMDDLKAILEVGELYIDSDIPYLEANESHLEGEEELLIYHSNELNESDQIKSNGPELTAGLSLPIEEIETSLIQLAQNIEICEQEAAEVLNEILDKIIEVPAKLTADNVENPITEAEAQAELEELFTELLERAGVEYTPELIDSLAHLTLKWHLADEIEKLKNEEESDKAPQGNGTHEIINKLLMGLSAIKKAMTHALAIGKSALELYNVNFAN